jgi:L-lactate dehydrogenase complex protein LldG
MSTGRDEILGKIRSAVGNVATSRAKSYAAIPRDYQKARQLDAEHKLDLFIKRLIDYEARVSRCSEEEIAETVAKALTERGKRRLAVPRNLPKSWLPLGFEFITDDGLSYEALDKSEGVITGCAIAIALTGTVVLRHAPGEGRRALTLIPDYHLCIVYANQLVETVAEGFHKLHELRKMPITMISGPSATSDIEMTRVKGVHGPRSLDVILVGE